MPTRSYNVGRSGVATLRTEACLSTSCKKGLRTAYSYIERYLPETKLIASGRKKSSFIWPIPGSNPNAPPPKMSVVPRSSFQTSSITNYIKIKYEECSRTPMPQELVLALLSHCRATHCFKSILELVICGSTLMTMRSEHPSYQWLRIPQLTTGSFLMPSSQHPPVPLEHHSQQTSPSPEHTGSPSIVRSASKGAAVAKFAIGIV